MYNVSNAYKYAIRQNTTESKIRCLITLLSGESFEITDEDIMAGTFSINNACVSGNEYELGSVFMGELKCIIKNNIDRYSLYGAKLAPVYSLKLADNSFEDVPLGIYYVYEANRTYSEISIKAYDQMNKFDKTPSGVSSGKPSELVSFISQVCGVELGMTLEEIDNLSPQYEGGDPIPVRCNVNDYATWRDVISDIAMTLGAFAYIDRFGRLNFRRFKTDTITLNNNHIKSATISDYEVKYDGINTIIDEQVYYAGEEEGHILEIQNNLWNTGETGEKQIIVDTVWETVENDNYIPIKLDYDGDPSFDLGDEITFQINNENFASVIQIFTWTHKGGMKIESVGSNPILEDATSTISKVYKQLSNEIQSGAFGVESTINLAEIEIDTTKKLIAEIECYCSQEVDIIISGQAVLLNTEDNEYDVYYEINENENIWQPSFEEFAGKRLINFFCNGHIDNVSGANIIKIYLKAKNELSEEATENYIGKIETNKETFAVFGALNKTDSGFTDFIAVNQDITKLNMPGFELINTEEGEVRYEEN